MELLIKASASAIMMIISIIVFLPQLKHTWQAKDASGVSPAGILGSAVGYTAWCFYLFIDEAWFMFTANMLGTIIFYAVMVACWRANMRFDLKNASIPLILIAFIIGMAAINYEQFGIALTINSLVVFLPKVFEAWRADSITGIAVGTWVSLLISGICHLILGAYGAPPAVTVWGFISVSSAIMIISAIHLRYEARGFQQRMPFSTHFKLR